MFSKKLFTDDIVLISLGQVKKTYVLIASGVFKKEEEARHFFFFFLKFTSTVLLRTIMILKII